MCVDNNRYISHRSSGGWMVATYGNGGQGTEGDIDYHLVVTGSISAEDGLRRRLEMDRARVRETEARLAALASQAEQEMPKMREVAPEPEAEPQAEAWYGEQEPGAKQIVEGVVVETEPGR